MKMPWFLSLLTFFLGITLAATPTTFAQDTASQGVNAGNLLGQLSAVFSSGAVISQIQLVGNATWHAGSLEDAGTITLTASSAGSSQMQLQLAATGSRTEAETGVGSSANCQWAGADGVAHTVDLGNCWRPALWFLPAFSFQPSLLPSYLGVVDLGSGTVGSSTNIYRHLQGQVVFTNFTSQTAARFAERSTTDIGLDPTSMLPMVLSYSVHPDNGAATNIAIEVRYADYRAVNGARIPFHIQRYVNGSLQLDIHVSSAQIS